MRPPNRKSTKSRESIQKLHADLGDTDAFDTSSESSEQDVTQRNSTFQSVDVDKEATDYGLEFTTSRIRQEISPRRHSTLHRQPVSQKHTTTISGTDSDDENFENSSHIANRTRSNPETPRSSNVAKKSTARGEGLTQTAHKQQVKQVHRRKQVPPRRKEQLFKRDVKRLQEATNLLVPRLPFSRVVREIMHEMSSSTMCITKTAFEALQTAAEMYLTQRFEDSYMLTLHRGRITLEVRDMLLVNYIRTQIR